MRPSITQRFNTVFPQQSEMMVNYLQGINRQIYVGEKETDLNFQSSRHQNVKVDWDS